MSVAPSTPDILRVQGLDFSWPQRLLFQGFSARIGSGVSLVRGDEGSGKTTLLRLLAADIPAQAGQLAIEGVDLVEQPAAYRARLFWADPKDAALDPVVASSYLASVQVRYPQWDEPRLAALVEGLALAEHLHKPSYMLSTGSRRKLCLAAGLAARVPLLLLDNPFAALDAPSIRVVRQALKDAAQDPHRAVVLADYEAPAGLPLAQVIDLPG
jgi:ABC-type multidrug transport system ATPase subunit